MKKMLAIMLATACFGCISLPAGAQTANPITITNFDNASGTNASASDIQNTWSALQALGTTKFVGGTIGNFKLDESSLIAGAMSIGVTELDNFLKTGSLSTSASGLGNLLSAAMGNSAGMDLSSLVGSYTAGGGSLDGLPLSTSASLTSSAGGATAAGQCDSGVASKQVAVGLGGVQNVVNSAMSDQYGFSQNSSLSDGNGNSSFAARDCLSNLFQNAGSDILFKPPSLGTLSQMLAGWSCNKAKSVSDQVNGQFGDMSQFNTASMGGFFPWGVYGEATDGTTPTRPGIGNSLGEVFGDTFSETNGSVASNLTSLKSVFN